jgi:hypothetical protein
MIKKVLPYITLGYFYHFFSIKKTIINSTFKLIFKKFKYKSIDTQPERQFLTLSTREDTEKSTIKESHYKTTKLLKLVWENKESPALKI